MKRYLLSITPKNQDGALQQIITALREQADTLESGRYGNVEPHGRMDTFTADVEWLQVKDSAAGPMDTAKAAPELYR